MSESDPFKGPLLKAISAANYATLIVITIRNFGSWSYEGGHIVRGLWDLLTVLPSQELEECKYEIKHPSNAIRNFKTHKTLKIYLGSNVKDCF